MEQERALLGTDPENPAYHAEYAQAFVSEWKTLPEGYHDTVSRITPVSRSRRQAPGIRILLENHGAGQVAACSAFGHPPGTARWDRRPIRLRWRHLPQGNRGCVLRLGDWLLAKNTLQNINPDLPDFGGYEIRLATRKREETREILGLEN